MEQHILGDYKIIRTMGQGALGMVFLAEHRFMKKQYFLKVLPDELASDSGFIQRFEEDISALARLEHPNIVKIHNISCSQGQYFLVMDFISSEGSEALNLAQYLMALGKKLEEEVIFTILKQIAGALDFAHNQKMQDKGIAHRNLKLNNILVCKKLGKPEIYLSDFGLSRIVGAGAVLTRTYKNVAEALNILPRIFAQKNGQDLYPSPSVEPQKLLPLHASFLQNYAFLAPEQKRLDSPFPVDTKADVYAFGVLAYFLLMNELPEGIFEMPSCKPEYRYKWDQLLLSCLHSHPYKRPSSLLEVLEAVIGQEQDVSISAHKQKMGTIQDDIPSQLASKYILCSQEPELCLSAPQPSLRHANAEDIQSPIKTLHSHSFQLKPVLGTSHLERPKEDLDPGAAFIIDSTVKTYQPEYKDFTHVKPLLTDMVIVDGASFFRGSHDGNRDELPRHQIAVSSFAVDIHPVTNEQFVRFLEVMGGEKDSTHNDIIRLRDSRIKRSAGKISIESGYAKHPVVGVTWYGAVAYSKWVGKRLPTEAEWEIAARGGKECALYPTGTDIEKSQANFFSADTTPVMSYVPNGYGLFDVSGNVYEWCLDWYGYNYYELSVQEPENPQGPLQGVYRVLRGGCWKSLKEDLRCSRRHRNNPGTVNSTYGFRCAADVEIL